MRNIKKYVNTYTNNVSEVDLQLIINGQYKKTMNKEDLELTRFMIGGIDAK